MKPIKETKIYQFYVNKFDYQIIIEKGNLYLFIVINLN